MGFFTRTEPEAKVLLAVHDRLERLEMKVRALEDRPQPDTRALESRLAALELETGKRQIEVLNLMEKVGRQLYQRERLRKAMDPEGGEAAPAPEASPSHLHGPEPTSHLARRFKIGG